MNWPLVPLGNICEINPRSLPAEHLDPETQVSFIPMSLIDAFSGCIVNQQIRSFSEVSRGYTYFQNNDVLFAKITPCMENGKSAIAEGLINGLGFGSTEFHVLRTSNLILPKWLFYFVRQPSFRALAKVNFTGTAGQQRVPGAFLRSISIPLPPLSEQRRIVEILDEADRIRKLRREANQKAERILPALFLKMFGDPATNPKGWDINTISKVVASADYGTSTKTSGVSGLPLIRMGNVDYSGRMDLTDLKYVQLEPSAVTRFRLEAGDILFNRTNSKELVGKTGLWDGIFEAIAASYFIRVRVNHNRVTPCFFWAFMNSDYMKRQLLLTARGAIGQANINSTELKSLPIITPPIDLQHLFSKRWESIKLSVSQQKRGATIFEKLFFDLLAHSFSGQLTSKWRKVRMKELVAEMEQQSRKLLSFSTRER